jgi:putative transcriptional regulator
VTSRHHVSDDLLVAYEAGSLAEGWSLAVATHIALCPACRRRAREAAALGGAMLEEIEPIDIDESSLAAVFNRIAAPGHDDQPAAPPLDRAIIPQPLRRYVGGDVGAIRWRRLGVAARHLPIRTSDMVTSVRLLRIRAGEPVPTHGHRGLELTVVLAGALVDGDEVFRRGDVEQADETVEHRPAAGPAEDCICLAVTDAPLRFKNLVARLAQPFLRI